MKRHTLRFHVLWINQNNQLQAKNAILVDWPVLGVARRSNQHCIVLFHKQITNFGNQVGFCYFWSTWILFKNDSFLNHPICDTNWFASHNTDVQTCWSWHNPAENVQLNILAGSRLQEVLGWWVSISFLLWIHLSEGEDTEASYHVHFACLICT